MARRKGDVCETPEQLPQIADLGLCITIQRFQNRELSNALSKFSERFTLNSFLPPG